MYSLLGKSADEIWFTPVVRVTGGANMMSADIVDVYFKSFTFNDYGLVQLKALPHWNGLSQSGITWYIINPGNNLIIGD